jgi:hypothetical protein
MRIPFLAPIGRPGRMHVLLFEGRARRGSVNPTRERGPETSQHRAGRDIRVAPLRDLSSTTEAVTAREGALGTAPRSHLELSCTPVLQPSRKCCFASCA